MSAWRSPRSRSVGNNNPASNFQTILDQTVIVNPHPEHKPPPIQIITPEQMDDLKNENFHERPIPYWLIGPPGGWREVLIFSALDTYSEHPVIWTGIIFVAGVAITIAATNRLGITKVTV